MRRGAYANVSEDKKETRIEGRRQKREENAVAINAARREAHKGTYGKTACKDLQRIKGNLICQVERLKSMSSARINNSDYCWRKRVVDDCIAEGKTIYLHLCNTNKGEILY